METFINVLTYIGYIIVAILCLMFMIIVHESGHYLAGKLLGFKINEFSIGFGPAIFKRKSKKTGQLFAIRWVPLGGYCAFYGEEDDGTEKKKEELAKQEQDIFEEQTQTFESTIVGDNVIKDAENIIDTASSESVDCKVKDIPFNDQKPWKRIIVFIAGALFNYISAIIIISIFFMAYGDYTMRVTKTYDIGIEQNFKVGDEIIAVEGKTLYTVIDGPNGVHEALSNGNDAKTVTIRRDGKIMDIKVNKGNFNTTDENGKPIVKKGYGISFVKEVEGGYAYDFGRIKSGFFEAIGKAFVFSFKIVGLLFVTLGKLFTGLLPVKGNVGGPVTTITTIAMVSSVGFDAIMYAVCAMSATLAIMNLLPLPALDGSKVVFTLIEWVRGKPINRKVENTIHLVGLFLLFGMTILFDILNFI